MSSPSRGVACRNAPRRQWTVVWGFTVAISVCSLGCGGEDWQVETFPAQGQVEVNGEPAAGAVVELHPVGAPPDERNSRPWGIVQENGVFTLSTYETGDGAPAGEYAVTLRWPPDVAQPSLADRLGGAYMRPQDSRWKVTISEGENELPEIAIDGARVQSREAASQSGAAPPGPTMPSKP